MECRTGSLTDFLHIFSSQLLLLSTLALSIIYISLWVFIDSGIYAY